MQPKLTVWGSFVCVFLKLKMNSEKSALLILQLYLDSSEHLLIICLGQHSARQSSFLWGEMMVKIKSCKNLIHSVASQDFGSWWGTKCCPYFVHMCTFMYPLPDCSCCAISLLLCWVGAVILLCPGSNSSRRGGKVKTRQGEMEGFLLIKLGQSGAAGHSRKEHVGK